MEEKGKKITSMILDLNLWQKSQIFCLQNHINFTKFIEICINEKLLQIENTLTQDLEKLRKGKMEEQFKFLTKEEHQKFGKVLKELNEYLGKKVCYLTPKSKSRKEWQAIKYLTALRGILDEICSKELQKEFSIDIYYGETNKKTNTQENLIQEKNG